MGPLIAMETTRSVRLSWRITGSSLTSGKSSMASISVFTSVRKRFSSPSATMSMVARPRLSRASQRTSSTSVRPSTASSIRWQIDSSTSSLAAPG
jgi:hypothetical protein